MDLNRPKDNFNEVIRGKHKDLTFASKEESEILCGRIRRVILSGRPLEYGSSANGVPDA